MVPVSQLQYARKYPFSPEARNVVKQLVPDISRVDDAGFEAALNLIEAAAMHDAKSRVAFIQQHLERRSISYPEFLERDIIAFPLAKIILSQMNMPALYERFASLMGDLTLEYLVNEPDKQTAFLDLAQSLKLRVDIVPQTHGIRVPFWAFIAFPLRDAQLHLVNQRVHQEYVYLDMNLACRWLAEFVHYQVASSLPADTRGLPSIFMEKAQVGLQRVNRVKKKEFSAAGLGLNRDAFPPCVEKLYSELDSGVNLAHMARFDLATFLVNINMPNEDIVSLFSKAPNFDERVTRYHIENLSGMKGGKKYSSPSCAKVREHGLCVSRTCNVGHPLQFYARESKANASPPEKNQDKDTSA